MTWAATLLQVFLRCSSVDPRPLSTDKAIAWSPSRDARLNASAMIQVPPARLDLLLNIIIGAENEVRIKILVHRVDRACDEGR
jgi:hypothetical protein